MKTPYTILALLLFGVGLSGCPDDGLTTGRLGEGFDCSTCHGSAGNPAPPVATNGSDESTSSLGVGAHQIHVKDGAVHAAFDCEVCHPTPDADDPLMHVDSLPAEIEFGGLAVMGDLVPKWDRSDATCANVYCHGAGLEIGGGAFPTPSWTFEDGAHPGSCEGCHGAPPPAPHPQDEDCATCHPGTVGADGLIDLEGALHIDGKVDVEIAGCSACHGFPPDPPHVQDTDCHACHGGTVNEDGGIVEGGLHKDGDVQWAPTTASCDKCHATPPAAPHTQDTACWTCHTGTVMDDGTIDVGGGLHMNGDVDVAGGPDSCDICHGDPPAPPHPPATSHTQCAWCHSETVTADGSIDEDGGHQNGTVESNGLHPDGFSAPTVHGQKFTLDGPSGCTVCHGEDLTGGPTGTSCEKCHPGFRTDCTFCHGGEDNDTGAPPSDVLGETATSFAGVGAHSSHLIANPFWHKAIGCSECHATYTDAMDPGHIDGIAALAWGEVATEEDANPTYADGSCSSVYCHGGFEDSDGANTAPTWTTVDGTQAACGDCHSLPPGGDHPQMADCSMCHGCVANPGPEIRPEGAAFHINGDVNTEGSGDCPDEE